MEKHQAWAAARHFKQMGIPIEHWPVFLCSPSSRIDQEEATKKSINRNRKKELRKTKEGQEELKKEKHLEALLCKIFGKVDLELREKYK